MALSLMRRNQFCLTEFAAFWRTFGNQKMTFQKVIRSKILRLKRMAKIVFQLENSPLFKSMDQQKIWDFVHTSDVRGLKNYIADNSKGHGYHTMTSRRLRDIAQARGISNYSKMCKDDLIVQLARTDQILRDMEHNVESLSIEDQPR